MSYWSNASREAFGYKPMPLIFSVNTKADTGSSDCSVSAFFIYSAIPQQLSLGIVFFYICGFRIGFLAEQYRYSEQCITLYRNMSPSTYPTNRLFNAQRRYTSASSIGSRDICNIHQRQSQQSVSDFTSESSSLYRYGQLKEQLLKNCFSDVHTYSC